MNDGDPHGLDEDEASRNYTAQPGYDLRDDISLAGWDERSVGGLRHGIGSFYAQSWRNPGDSDAPDAWLSGINPPLPRPGCVVAAVAEATGCDPVSTMRALGLAHPHPILPPLPDVVAAATPLIYGADDAYSVGKLAVLEWVIGMATATPAANGRGENIGRRHPKKWRPSST